MPIMIGFEFDNIFLAFFKSKLSEILREEGPLARVLRDEKKLTEILRLENMMLWLSNYYQKKTH